LFWSQVFQKRLKMKIKLKTLPNIKWKSIFQEYYKKELRLAEVRYTSQEFPTGIFIFKDNILNVLWNEKPAAFLIKSKENAERWKLFFDEQWKIANP